MSYLNSIRDRASSVHIVMVNTAKASCIHMKHTVNWCRQHKSTCVLVGAAALATFLIGSTSNPLSLAASRVWTSISTASAKFITFKIGTTLILVLCAAGYVLYRKTTAQLDAAREERDTARAERDAEKELRTSIEAELTALKTQHSEAKARIDELNTECFDLQLQLTESKNARDELESMLAIVRRQVERSAETSTDTSTDTQVKAARLQRMLSRKREQGPDFS